LAKCWCAWRNQRSASERVKGLETDRASKRRTPDLMNVIIS
jgi:hypothetical protein